MEDNMRRFVLACLTFTLALLVCGSVSAGEWHTETVDSTGNVGEFTSLALDSNDYPHISYYAGYPDYDLKYASWTGSQWVLETVDSTGYVGGFTSLALDSNDYPHISYRDDTNYDLKYAFWTGSQWVLETVDSTGYVGYYTSLALDSNDYPHISYRDETNYDLKYAFWTGSQWIVETVDSTGYVGGFTSLALDSNGYPHISYYDGTNYDLKYAFWTGSQWIVETVDSTGTVGQYTSLALDSNGYPHISYYDWINSDLKYAFWTGSQWIVETVDSTGYVGGFTSLALDSNGYPHISYLDGTNVDLKYASWTGSQWVLETVDSTGDVGFYTSLALDSNNYPHISYYDITNVDLRYAWFTGSELLADIAVEKEFLDGTTWQPISSAGPGDLVYGLVNVMNNGPDPATAVTVLDLPTTGLEYMGTYYTSYDDGATWQYLDGSFDAASGVWTVGNMPPNDSYLLAILYQVSGTDTIYNVALSDRSQARETDPNLYNNLDVAILDILEADVWTSKEVTNLSHPAESINYLDDIRYLISVGNNGPDMAENVMAWETIPTGFDLDTWAVSWDNGITWISEDPSFDPATGWWEIGNLANGAAALLRLDGTVIDSDFGLYNYADAYGDTYDPNLDNNWDEITLQVPPAADLTISKESDRMRYHRGDLVTFWIDVYNWGPDTAENVEVADFLSPGLNLIDYDLSTGYLDMVDMIWYVGDLEAGDDAWLELICQATGLGAQTNTVDVTSDTYDPDPEDNTDTATIGVIPPTGTRPIPCPPHWTCQGHQVPMQPTGASFAGLILAVLAVLSGLTTIKRE